MRERFAPVALQDFVQAAIQILQRWGGQGIKRPGINQETKWVPEQPLLKIEIA
jgi:hypothetical protein